MVNSFESQFFAFYLSNQKQCLFTSISSVNQQAFARIRSTQYQASYSKSLFLFFFEIQYSKTYRKLPKNNMNSHHKSQDKGTGVEIQVLGPDCPDPVQMVPLSTVRHGVFYPKTKSVSVSTHALLLQPLATSSLLYLCGLVYPDISYK